MKEKFSKIAVVIGSSMFVVAFGLVIAFLNQAGNNNPENVFVTDDVQLDTPQSVDYISENGFAFQYDEAKWGVIEQDVSSDIKLRNLNTNDTVTLISSVRLENQGLYQPDNYGRLDERSLRNVSEKFETKIAKINEFDQAQFYILDYSIKLFDTSEESDVVRYITASDENVIKFISAYTSEETKRDIEELINSFYLY